MDNTSSIIAPQKYLVHQNLLRIAEFPEEGIFSQVLVRSELCTYTLFGLSDGNGVKFHCSTGTTTLQVLFGQGILRLDDTEVKLDTGTFIFIPAGIVQGLEATGDLAVLHMINHE